MTPLNDEGLVKLERALSEAHRLRQEPSLGADWALRVMRDIRREAPGAGQLIMHLGLDRLVWRTAAVAAVLALVFTGSVLFYANGDAVESTTLLASEFDATAPLIE
jgi:hypothetical protein